MVELDAFKSELNTYTEPLKEVRDSLDLENKEKRVEELEREMEAPGFWDNAERSQKMMKELSALKGDMEIYHKLKNQKEEIELMIEMGYEENDESVIPDIEEMMEEFKTDFDHIRIKTLLLAHKPIKNCICDMIQNQRKTNEYIYTNQGCNIPSDHGCFLHASFTIS